MKLYCPRCEDIYTPKSLRHAALDGAYFGTTFPHLLIQVYPVIVQQIGTERERYVPRIFGFKIRRYAREMRFQDKVRKEMEMRLKGDVSVKEEKVQKRLEGGSKITEADMNGRNNVAL